MIYLGEYSDVIGKFYDLGLVIQYHPKVYRLSVIIRRMSNIELYHSELSKLFNVTTIKSIGQGLQGFDIAVCDFESVYELVDELELAYTNCILRTHSVEPNEISYIKEVVDVMRN